MAARILIIDDEKIQASYYELALKRRGYEVEQALDVDDALQKAKQWKPDLVILDIMMPLGQKYEDVEHYPGLKTGTFLITDLRIALPQLIIVVSTVVDNPETLQLVRSLLPSEQVTLKAQSTPNQLADLIDRLLRRKSGNKPYE